MAYQTRGRDPLFDTDMAQAIEKRGKELLGLALLCLGLAAAAMIISYHPDDPSFLAVTDAPVQNWLGRFGASIAGPLFMIVGWGAWGLAIVLAAWGVRFALHRGAERAIGRLIFAPIWIAVLSLYATSLVPGQAWAATHSFGLGGLFGETVMGAILYVLPLGSHFALKLMSLLMGLFTVALGAFVLGFTRVEIMRIARFLLIGLVMSYAWVMTLLGRGAGGALAGAQALKIKQAERRETRAREAAEAAEWAAQQAQTAPPQVRYDAHSNDDQMLENFREPLEPEQEKPSLLSRMPSLVRRSDPAPMPEPELVEAGQAPDADAPDQDRVKARISDVIKARVRSGPAVSQSPVAMREAPLTKGRGRGPDPLVLNVGHMDATGDLPAEPPLTAAHIHDAPLDQVEPMMERVMEQTTPPTPLADLGVATDFTPEAEPAPAPAPQNLRPAIPVPEPKKVVQHPPRKTMQPSTRAQAEAQPALKFDEQAAEYELPPLGLLSDPSLVKRHHLSDDALEQNARMLEAVLDDYGVKGEIVSVRPGPVVTMYELEPAPGLKASRVIGLSDDIARSMSALSARVSTVPGRSVIGIELPNENREMVNFREILSTRDFGDSTMKLPLALGKDIGGDPVVANLAKMPHLLIAGTTGSGKSVAINTMILSLLYRLTPEDCRLIMIDPKMLELSVYDGIPHLLSPVVTDPKKAVVALKWTVGEMEERYRKMSKMGVRNIDGYNSRVADALSKGEMFSRTVQTGFDDDTGEPVFETEEFAPEKMPYIVVIVDEMADLMMVAGKEIEACIQRLAQMARASGIHLIMATQRPSVDVITGTIKANFPTRISFQVTSKIDSRTILGEMGAEQLLGMGDMLYMAGGAKITRCHGPFVSDEEVEEIVNHLKAYGPPEYMNSVLDGPSDDREADIDAVLGLGSGDKDTEDALYDTAVAIVIKDRKCSTSYIQRKLSIGYNKAARLVEQMEDEGVVSGANHVGKREVLVPEQH